MGKRNPNHRLVKIHRTYTVGEVARLFGAHKNTVWNWVKRGLITCDDRRPALILGRDLVAFLKARRAKNKCPCKLSEIYCVCCRAPKIPAGGLVEYQPTTTTLGNLIAICPDCDRMMNRRAGLAKLGQFRGQMTITLPQALPHINDSSQPSVNSDLRQGAADHAKTQP
jgi:Helix-turn-helix domain